MTTKVHSKLGASSCERWANCPGSVALLSNLPPEPDSPAAREGTAAHNWCEFLLSRGDRDAREYIGTRIDAKLVNNEMTAEQADAINVYLATVYEQADKPNAVLYVERKFHLLEVDADAYGTNDASVYVPGERTLYVFDYKHGVGVSVDVTGNKQARYYAYGGWMQHRDDGVDTVVCNIVQPRAHGEPVKSEAIDVLELVDWSFDLKEWIDATRKPDAPLNPGPWCNKTFCAARRGQCPALKAVADAALADGFAAVPEAPSDTTAAAMSADELGRRYAELDTLRTYIKGIEALAEREAILGRMPHGFKWVLSSGGHRRWLSEKSSDEIAKEVTRISNAVDPWDKKLKSPAAVEKALGKSVFKSLSGLVEKPPGRPTLAPVSDKREAWSGDTSGFSPQDETETETDD